MHTHRIYPFLRLHVESQIRLTLTMLILDEQSERLRGQRQIKPAPGYTSVLIQSDRVREIRTV